MLGKYGPKKTNIFRMNHKPYEAITKRSQLKNTKRSQLKNKANKTKDKVNKSEYIASRAYRFP